MIPHRTKASILENLPVLPAELRAQQRPPFNLTDPVYPAFDEADKVEQEQRALRLLEALERAKAEQATELVIEPGDYRFRKNVGCELEGFSDLTIQARGVTFYFEREVKDLIKPVNRLSLLNCKNVSIIGLCIDYDPLPWIQAQIVDLHSDEANSEYYLKARLMDEFTPVESGMNQLFFFKEDGSFIPPIGAPFQDRMVPLEGRDIRIDVPQWIIQSIVEKKSAHPDQPGSGLQIGDYLVSTFRDEKGFLLQNCEKVKLEDVTLYASSGMGILERYGEGGNMYNRFSIIRRPSTSRLFACCGDTFHCISVKNGAQITDCELSFSGDDGVNLFTFFGLITHVYSATEAVFTKHGIQHFPFEVGETLKIYDLKSMHCVGEPKVVSFTEETDPELIANIDVVKKDVGYPTEIISPMRVCFEQPLEALLIEGRQYIVHYNAPRHEGFLIKDNYFHDSVGRATLLTGPYNGTFENNTFKNYGGLQVFMETWCYMVGPMPEKIKIANNRFFGSTRIPDGGGGPAGPDLPIQGTIYTGIKTTPYYQRATMPVTDIEITGNLIVDSTVGILLTNTKGALVKDNTIINPLGYADAYDLDVGTEFYGKSLDAGIYVSVCEDITIEGNTIIDEAGLMGHKAVDYGERCANIEVDGVQLPDSGIDCLTYFSEVNGGAGWGYHSLSVEPGADPADILQAASVPMEHYETYRRMPTPVPENKYLPLAEMEEGSWSSQANAECFIRKMTLQSVTDSGLSILACRELTVEKDALFIRGYFQLLEGRGQLLIASGDRILKQLTPTDALSHFEFKLEGLQPGSTLRMILTENSGVGTSLKFQARIS